jgi:ribosomal protein L7/L12
MRPSLMLLIIIGAIFAVILIRLRRARAGTVIVTPPTMEQVEAAIDAGQKIEAIRLYRLITGFGLRDAKEAVEALAARRK